MSGLTKNLEEGKISGREIFPNSLTVKQMYISGSTVACVLSHYGKWELSPLGMRQIINLEDRKHGQWSHFRIISLKEIVKEIQTLGV